MEKVSIKRSPDCCGCPSFPYALCPPCQRYNLRNNHPDWPFNTDPATYEQPIPYGDIEIAPLVQKDIEERAKVGCKKYGELLKSNNGRNALWDAYQEALDLCMYLRQKIEEEK